MVAIEPRPCRRDANLVGQGWSEPVEDSVHERYRSISSLAWRASAARSHLLRSTLRGPPPPVVGIGGACFIMRTCVASRVSLREWRSTRGALNAVAAAPSAPALRGRGGRCARCRTGASTGCRITPAPRRDRAGASRPAASTRQQRGRCRDAIGRAAAVPGRRSRRRRQPLLRLRRTASRSIDGGAADRLAKSPAKSPALQPILVVSPTGARVGERPVAVRRAIPEEDQRRAAQQRSR